LIGCVPTMLYSTVSHAPSRLLKASTAIAVVGFTPVLPDRLKRR
jgi:hypothetical protein